MFLVVASFLFSLRKKEDGILVSLHEKFASSEFTPQIYLGFKDLVVSFGYFQQAICTKEKPFVGRMKTRL